MKIEELNLYKYTLPLNKPVKMMGHIQNERNGLIVEVIDNEKNVGYGEAAPFPGLHVDSIDALMEQFKKLKSHLLKYTLDDFRSSFLDLPGCSPILHFAIEWAIIDLISKEKNSIPAAILNSAHNNYIYSNPLLAGDFDIIVNQAKKIRKSNPLSVKIKVGSMPLEDDIYLVKKLDDIFENKIGLRLDANRSWSLNQAVTFGHAVRSSNLEYIEEPVDDPLLLGEFYKRTGGHYALDETLSEYSSKNILKMEGIAAFIIKPSVIGSMRIIKSWIDLASRININCIFSNTFESGIGLWSNAHLAAAFSRETIAHGLDTSSWLKEDLIYPPFNPKNFKLKIPEDSEYFTVNKNLLNPINI